MIDAGVVQEDQYADEETRRRYPATSPVAYDTTRFAATRELTKANIVRERLSPAGLF